MNEKKPLLLFAFISVGIGLLNAQIDDFIMRYEQEYAHSKHQEMGYVPQKSSAFSKEQKQHLHYNFSDLLKNQTNFYLSRDALYSTPIYYQNRKTSPTIAIQNVDFSSSILENNFQLVQAMHPMAFQNINCYQGYSSAQLQFNAAQIALNYNLEPNQKDSTGYQIEGTAGAGNQDFSGFFQFRLHKKKWNYLLHIFGGQTHHYQLGIHSTQTPWLSWQRIANTYNGPMSGSWIMNPDSLSIKERNVFVGIDQLINFKLKHQNELNLYLHMEGRQDANIGSTIQKSNDYLYSYSHTDFLPKILAFIQKKMVSETSPIYTQMQLTLAYQNISNQTNMRYDLQDEELRRHLEENKFSLQLRGFKNINPSHVLFYGAEISATSVKNNFHRTDTFNSFFNTPLTKAFSYLKLEKRQSADISWFFGARGGFENSSFRYLPFVQTYTNVFRPFGEINVSWQRHTCESSNYLINVFLRSKSPQLSEYNPLFQHVFLIPNAHLGNEMELLIESHLYRKFDDKLEIHLSPYFRKSWNTLVLKDNFGNPNEKISYGLREYYTQQYTNYASITEGGATIDLRYNFSKQLLLYQQISLQHVWTSIDPNIFYPTIPIYGNVGLKFKTNKILLASWLHYNVGRTFSHPSSSQYIQYYGRTNGTSIEFPGYIEFNLATLIHLSEKLQLQGNIENILDRYSIDFLSTLPNSGRRMRLQMRFML